MVTLNLNSLTYCFGCITSILDMDERLLDLLAEIEILYCPPLLDFKEIPKSNIAIVDGCVRTKEDENRLKEIREKSDILIGIGSCAAFGGITGLGSLFSSTETLNEIFMSDKLLKKTIPNTGVPPLKERVYPLHEFVTVDYYITGCPPTSDLIFDAISALLKGDKPNRYEKPVCAECPRIVKEETLEHLLPFHEKIPDPEECLLSQGFLCRGSVTRGGCGAPCPDNGTPCLGCRGPSDKVLKRRDKDPLSTLIDRISRITNLPEEEIMREIGRVASVPHTFYTYLISSPEMKLKPRSTISEYIYRFYETEKV